MNRMRPLLRTNIMNASRLREIACAIGVRGSSDVGSGGSKLPTASAHRSTCERHAGVEFIDENGEACGFEGPKTENPGNETV